MTKLMQTFLSGLRRLRSGQRSGAAAIYWRAVDAIAAGSTPKDRPAAIAEALDRLDRSEDDLAADAQTLAELRRVEVQAKQKAAARARLKGTAVAQAKTEEQATALERQARDLRDQAAAAKFAATCELELAAKAAEQVDRLAQELAQRGHPVYVAAIDQARRDREVGALEAQVRTIAEELHSAREAAVERPADARDRLLYSDRILERARGRVAMLEAQSARLQERIAAIRNGEPDVDAASEIDDDEPAGVPGVEAS